jgi:metal-dependent hydrolase (beta-lactamase superfamily II)
VIRTVLRGRSLTSGVCGVYLVTTPDTRILFDTGHVGRRRALLRALSDLELTPADIDVVVLSHAHWDHVHLPGHTSWSPASRTSSGRVTTGRSHLRTSRRKP